MSAYLLGNAPNLYNADGSPAGQMGLDGVEYPSSVSGGGTPGRASLYGGNRPKMMGIGNSIMRLQRLNAYGGGNNQASAYNWLWWAQSFLGWPMQFLLTGPETTVGADTTNSSMRDGIYGWSGGSSVQIVSVMDTVLNGRAPNYVFLHMMENDPAAVDGATATVAACLAAYQSAINKVKAIGATAIFVECLPSSGYTTAGMKAAYYQLINGARDICRESGAIYVPTWDLYTDASSANPIPLNSGSWANNVFTQVHPMQAGVLIGERVADVLTKYGLSIIEAGGMVPHSGAQHIHGNALMSGSGGFQGGGYTGTSPTGISVITDATTPTCTVANTVWKGRQVSDIAFTAGAQTGIKTIAQWYNSTYATTGFAIGDLVSAYCDIELTGTSYTGLRTIEQSMAFNGTAGADNPVFGSIASGDLVSLPIPLSRKIRMMTPVVVVPTGTTGVRQTTKILAASGAASVALNARCYGVGVVNWSAT